MASYQELKATADALGISVQDLLGRLSYETGGSLDPQQLGPTTQWGQHQGLIQFGKPQAAASGVDFSTPESAWATQLGADGGIVDYTLKTGYTPGVHDADNFYAAVNAGNPNKFNATDAYNGGAPGTVADKINNQIPAHTAKFGGADAAINALAETGIVMNPDGSISRAQSRPAMPGGQPTLNEDGSIGPAPEDMDVDEFLNRFDGNLGTGAGGGGTGGRGGSGGSASGAGLPMFEAPELSGWDKTRTTMMDVADVYFNGIRGRAPTSQGRGKAVRDEIMGKKTRNATAEWLAQNARQDLADAVLSGAMTGSQAAAEMYNKTTGANRYKAVGDKIFDTQTGQFVDNAGEAEGATPQISKEKLTQANTLRDDLRQDLSTFRDVSYAYQQVDNAYQPDNPSNASDYAMAVAFAKLVDPGSVAREGEVKAVQSAAGVFPALAQGFEAVQGGGTLPPTVRDQLYALARQTYEQQYQQAQGLHSQYVDMFTGAGIPETYIPALGDVIEPRAAGGTAPGFGE